MADRTIVIPDIADDSDGLEYRLQRINGAWVQTVMYTHPLTGFVSGPVEVTMAEMTAPQRAAVRAAILPAVNLAKPKMGF